MLFTCDGCGCVPITTQRWHCDVCLGLWFDFCDACHNEREPHDLHNHDHSMSAISVLDGFFKIVPYRGGEHDLKELMKRDPHFNFNLSMY
jgi:hypothetical protein